MSQVSPGRYPDPSGRFVQRYHDGSRWTEHVADAHGNRDTDAPVGQAGPASHADSAQHSQHYGQAGQRSSDPYGQQSAAADHGYGGQSAREQYGQDVTGSERGYDPGVSSSERGYDQWEGREQDWGQERPGSNRGYGDPRAETGWDQAGAGSWQPQGGGPAARDVWPRGTGATQQGGDGWAAAGGPATGQDWRPARARGRRGTTPVRTTAGQRDTGSPRPTAIPATPMRRPARPAGFRRRSDSSSPASAPC